MLERLDHSTLKWVPASLPELAGAAYDSGVMPGLSHDGGFDYVHIPPASQGRLIFRLPHPRREKPTPTHPADMYPSCIHDKLEPRVVRVKAHRDAVEKLKPLLKPGDRIRAVRGECGARPATYTFAGWCGDWISTASGIDTIIPASVSSINGKSLISDFEEV